MNSNHSGKEKREIGMELKYCEHCGSLWVRERGGGVYCEKCQRAMEELPASKKRPAKVMLPVLPPTAIESYAFRIETKNMNELEIGGRPVMSNVIAWMAAEAEGTPQGASAGFPRRKRHERPEYLSTQMSTQEVRERQLAEQGDSQRPEELAFHLRVRAEEDRERTRRTYRGRTVAMLRRYMRYSIETGRLPSLLGREFFRAKVTSYTVATFEDRVIFVHDMEKCLARLDDFSQQLIARHILQEHDQAATAKLLHCTERTVRTYMPVVLDLLVEILLDVGLMKAIEVVSENSYQEEENGEMLSSRDEKHTV